MDFAEFAGSPMIRAGGSHYLIDIGTGHYGDASPFRAAAISNRFQMNADRQPLRKKSKGKSGKTR